MCQTAQCTKFHAILTSAHSIIHFCNIYAEGRTDHICLEMSDVNELTFALNKVVRYDFYAVSSGRPLISPEQPRNIAQEQKAKDFQ